MTIPASDRKKDITFEFPHVGLNVKERGEKFFLYGKSYVDARKEFENAIKNENIGVIVEDKRKISSTHHCLFLSSVGELIILPFILGSKIDVRTMFPARTHKPAQEAKWFYEQYNGVAKKRNMPIAVMPMEILIDENR